MSRWTSAGMPERREPTLNVRLEGPGDIPDDGWHYVMGDQEAGPVRKSDVLAAASRSPPGTEILVWRPGLPNWISLQQSGLLQDRPAPLAGPTAHLVPQSFKATFFSFAGRMPRLRFFWWSCLVSAAYVGLVGAVLLSMHLEFDAPDAVVLRLGLALPFLWCLVALVVKRLHDLDRSARHLVWLVPVLWAPNLPASMPARVMLSIGSLVVELCLLFRRGTAGPNAFGPDPLGHHPSGAPHSAWDPEADPPKRRWGLWVVGGLVVAAIIGLIIFVADTGAPSCSDQGVAEKVRQIVADNSLGDATVFLSGGPDNVMFSVRNVRTLSNDEPLNGRTCAASVVISAKKGLLGKGDLGSEEVTFTVQNIDAQPGRYIVSVRR